MPQTINQTGFSALNVPVELCNLLKRIHITEPTPIQEKSIPIALSGKDLIGIAQTGTGKTLAFGLPMICRMQPKEVGLILAPTRELAQQIAETFDKLNVRAALVIGGASMGNQIRELRNLPRVIVATPGRLIDHLNQGTVRLNDVSIVVLDEADRMLDMGFTPAINRILACAPDERQTLLFSATMPREIAELAQNYMQSPVRVETDQAGSAPDLVDQELRYIGFSEKHTVLAEILSENQGSVLVFSRTRHGARKLTKSLRDEGHHAAEIHADRTLAQRREALSGFKSGYYRILVATDIAARGIDVKDISLVVNFDLPDQAEDYLHRIGRTGRAGAKGKSISLALTSQSKLVREIERLMGARIDVSPRSSEKPMPFRTAQAQTKKLAQDRPNSNRNRFAKPQTRDNNESATRPFDSRPKPAGQDRHWNKKSSKPGFASPSYAPKSNSDSAAKSKPAGRQWNQRDNRSQGSAGPAKATENTAPVHHSRYIPSAAGPKSNSNFKSRRPEGRTGFRRK